MAALAPKIVTQFLTPRERVVVATIARSGGFSAGRQATGYEKKDLLESLSAEEVQIVRAAFVAEATKIADHSGANFPVDCRIDDGVRAVRITEAPSDRDATAPVARIENA